MPGRMMVIGLDAADLDVLRPLLDRGDMPNLARLMEQGCSGVLHSTVPPVSAPAWASFLTGRNPGRHGLYSFVVERGRGAGPGLANLTDIRGPKLWDLCASQGVRPVVANVPVTWPPPSFEGALVCGMLTPEAEGVAFTHPRELAAEIAERVPGYRIDVDRAMLEDRATLFARMSAMTRRRRDLFVHLLRTQDWGLFVGVFTNTDRVQHSFWRHDRRLVDEHFREVDGHLGELLAEVDPARTPVLLMSDHGFQGARFKLYVNRLLAERGLLATRRAARLDEGLDRRRPDYFQEFQGGRAGDARSGILRNVLAAVGVGGELSVDWSRTRAFMWSLDSGGVAVNLASRYAHGTVPDEEYERVRDEVVAVLSEQRTPQGAPLFRAVRRREDVFEGPYVDGAPDVIAEPTDEVAFGIDLDAKETLRRHKRPEGHHSPRGFVCLAGPGFRRGARLEGHITDCLPTILHTLGLAVPEGCDGRVLSEAFTDPAPVRTMPDPDDRPAEGAAYTAAEEAELRRSLEGLGYL